MNDKLSASWVLVIGTLFIAYYYWRTKRTVVSKVAGSGYIEMLGAPGAGTLLGNSPTPGGGVGPSWEKLFPPLTPSEIAAQLRRTGEGAKEARKFPYPPTIPNVYDPKYREDVNERLQ